MGRSRIVIRDLAKTFREGEYRVPADLVHSARFLGASERQIMRTVVVPSALAWTFAALTPSISFALIDVVLALGIKQLEMRLLRWRPEYRRR